MLEQLNIQGVDAKSCSLTKPVSDTKSPSITKPVSDTKSLLRFLNSGRENLKGGIGTYQPGGRKARYFRFSYRDGNRTKHCHIPGGNIYSSLALERAMEIQQMADTGVSIENILGIIDNFS